MIENGRQTRRQESEPAEQQVDREFGRAVIRDKVQRILAVCAGGGDPEIRAELLQPGSEARAIVEELDRLVAKPIDIRQVAGLEKVIELHEAYLNRVNENGTRESPTPGERNP